jgi:hypothetical protein
MKKLFAILAVVMLVVACGGEQKKPMTIEDKFMDYISQIEKAVEAGDAEKAESLIVAFDEWGTSLDEKDMAEIEKVASKNEDRIFKAMIACEALVTAEVEEYYEECFDECCIDADEAIEAYDEAVEEAVEDVEDAMEEAMDELF